MRIGEFARRGGVSASKVRFYEAEGLLPQSARSANGYRNYDEADLRVIGFVDRARALGFTLSEIALFMSRPALARRAKEGVVSALEAKLAEADRLMAELTERRSRIAAMLADLKNGPHPPRC